jgi:hypothetical protein
MPLRLHDNGPSGSALDSTRGSRRTPRAGGPPRRPVVTRGHDGDIAVKGPSRTSSWGPSSLRRRAPTPTRGANELRRSALVASPDLIRQGDALRSRPSRVIPSRPHGGPDCRRLPATGLQPTTSNRHGSRSGIAASEMGRREELDVDRVLLVAGKDWWWEVSRPPRSPRAANRIPAGYRVRQGQGRVRRGDVSPGAHIRGLTRDAFADAVVRAASLT